MRSLVTAGLLMLAGVASAGVMKPDAAALEAAPAAFPYEAWDALLEKYVDGEGRVDYRALAGNAGDRARLEQVFASVAATGPTTRPEKFKTKPAQLAYYLNAYNVLVWKNVLARLPKLTNVDREKASFFGLTTFVVDGREINLRDLENEVIRARFKDARVHMALNCASGGCPALPREAFTPAKLDAQLSREARRFVGEKRNVDFDPATKTLRLSRIFDWYKDDFGTEPARVIGWINQHRAGSAKLPADAKIAYVDYDWTLNDVHLLAR